MMGVQLDRGLHDTHHVIEAIELVVDSAEVEMQIGALGVLADAFFQNPGRIVELILLPIGQAQDDVGFRLFRIDRDGLGQMVNGLGKLLQPVKQYAEMQMPFEIGGLQLHVKCVSLDSFLRVLGFLIKKPQIVSDFELCRASLQNLDQLVDGLGIVLLFPIQERQPELGIEVRRILRQQFPNSFLAP